IVAADIGRQGADVVPECRMTSQGDDKCHSGMSTSSRPFVETRRYHGYIPRMHSDIVDLRSFYSTTLGRFAERSITMALSSIWADVPNERLVGLGYTLPWLDRFGADAERVF